KDIQYFISSGLVKTDGQITPTYTFDSIPSWVKQVTNWWTQGTISDYSYVNTIQFLLDEKVIK
ncbi:MAG: peptidase, partial [Thaumarchaeota archaeon]|nr:peptidase [Nitrososphaerota archaeon]